MDAISGKELTTALRFLYNGQYGVQTELYYKEGNYAMMAGCIAGTIANLCGTVAGVLDDGVSGVGGKVSGGGYQGGSKAVKTDFYVTPSGDAIPSTGYRYVARNTDAIQNARKGSISARVMALIFRLIKWTMPL